MVCCMYLHIKKTYFFLQHLKIMKKVKQANIDKVQHRGEAKPTRYQISHATGLYMDTVKKNTIFVVVINIIQCILMLVIFLIFQGDCQNKVCQLPNKKTGYQVNDIDTFHIL